MHDSKKISESVINYLTEIMGGKCSITKQVIEEQYLQDPGYGEILMGLAHLHEDLEYQRQQLEREKAKFEQFVNLAPVGIAINRMEDGGFDYINSEFGRFTGYSVDELNSMDYWQLTPKKYEDQELEQLKSMTETGRYGPYQKEYTHKDGHDYPVLLSGIKITEFDGKDYIWSVVQDITEQQQKEQQLLEAKRSAEKANRIKSEFLSNMSHEIRTPMNGIVGLTQLLLSSSLNEQQTEWVEGIRESSHTLVTVINDILDISKIESGKLDIESVPFDIKELLDQLKQITQISAENKGLTFSVTKPDFEHTRYIGDSTRIKQVLSNLCHNAIKFTEQGLISVDVEVCKTNSSLTDKLTFIVSDTGIGIAPEKIGSLFERFSQADSSTTRRFGGTGLGLSICKQLVELMGGEIGCDSIQGDGSTFWFTLNLNKASVPPQAKLPTTLPSKLKTRSLKALVVEDIKINQIVATHLLEIIGIKTEVAENGLEAIEMLEENQFDLIFMDCHMPVMDGYEASKKIRSSKAYKHLPIIAITAGAMQKDRSKCLESGMDLVITKPFETSDIIEALTSLKII